MPNISKKGALQVTTDLDRIANLVSTEWQALGLPEKVAHDFAHRCDQIGDRVERTAGVQRNASGEVVADFNPTDIGEEVKGPMEADSDESKYMGGEFSQQENRELREKQEGGDVSPSGTSLEPQPPKSGVQASIRDLTASLKGAKYGPKGAKRVAKALALAAQIAKSAKDDDADEDKEDKAAGQNDDYGN